MPLNPEDLKQIRQTMREKLRPRAGAPIAQGPSLDQIVERGLKIKRQELEDKRPLWGPPGRRNMQPRWQHLIPPNALPHGKPRWF